MFPNLIIRPSDDLSMWYFVVHGLQDTDYENGIYIGKVMLPQKYPFKAPDFQFLTPSGRFEINKKLCTSFTGYHQELYSPSWNIASMCAGLVSFMTDSTDLIESKGIGALHTTSEFKKDIAMKSRDYIKNNKVVLEIFQKHFSDYYSILRF